jgi:Mg2+ and Co2+ transporter CorA
MRVFHVAPDRFAEFADLPEALPGIGFLWISAVRSEFDARVALLQKHLQRWEGSPLVDLHVSDLLNPQLPSHYDYTSWYDLLVFRRLVAGPSPAKDAQAMVASPRRALQGIDTSPVGFALFDHVLITIHPSDCAVLEHFAQRMAGNGPAGVETRTALRLPASPADLMLRMVNHVVDSYLDLRRLLTHQLEALQAALLSPKSRFRDWPVLLESRNTLHLLEDTCEDQQAAVQEWIDSLGEWPEPADAAARRDRELLRVRSRDVLEHIERVLSHVRRLEQSTENAVQMHFSAVGHRTNDIMRTLTVLTAIFLPLNLVTGIFGMNFDALPLIHTATGLWITFGLMAAIGIGLGLFFWRKRYLSARG